MKGKKEGEGGGEGEKHGKEREGERESRTWDGVRDQMCEVPLANHLWNFVMFIGTWGR